MPFSALYKGHYTMSEHQKHPSYQSLGNCGTVMGLYTWVPLSSAWLANHSHGEDRTLRSVVYCESIVIPEASQLSQYYRHLWNCNDSNEPLLVLLSSAWVANYSYGEERRLVWVQAVLGSYMHWATAWRTLTLRISNSYPGDRWHKVITHSQSQSCPRSV